MNVLDKIAPIHKVLAVDVFFLPDGTLDVRTMEFCKKRGSLIFGKRTPLKLDGIEELKAKSPCLLTLSGRGILIKKIDRIREENILSSCLPNANPREFLVEYVEAKGSYLVAICRRSFVDQVLTQLETSGTSVVGISLGLRDLKNVSAALGKEEICSRSLRLPEPNSVNKLPQEGNRLDIDGDVIPGDYVACFAHAMSFITGGGSHSEMVSAQYMSAQFKRLYRRTGVVMLTGLFVIMLVNLVVFDCCQKEHQKLAKQHKLSKSLLLDLDVVQKEIDLHAELIAKSGLTENTRISEYTERIGELVPEEIALTTLIIAPLNDKTKRQRRMEFAHDKITIEGGSNSITQLNNWMNEVRRLDFVRELELVNYEQEVHGQGRFSIALQVE